MSYEVLVTDNFKKEVKKLVKKHKSLKSDISRIVDTLSKKPTTGVGLGNNCYKIRISIKSKGKGKSGGARLITFVKVQNEKVYLVSIYDKSKMDSISDLRLKKLLKLANLL